MDILILIVILGVLYTLFMLPARRRRTQHAAMQDAIAAGDEIITAGGLHGHVRSFDDEANTVRVEIAPNTIVTLDRRAVAAVAREVEVEVVPEPESAENAPETGEEPR